MNTKQHRGRMRAAVAIATLVAALTTGATGALAAKPPKKNQPVASLPVSIAPDDGLVSATSTAAVSYADVSYEDVSYSD